jgi:hypothetical protein
MDGVEDFGVVDALEVEGGDPEVAVAELALDEDEGDASVGHLDGVSVPELGPGPSAPARQLERQSDADQLALPRSPSASRASLR